MRKYNDGCDNPNYKHGGKGTRLYSIWKDIKKRCTNPNHIGWKYYGGKGIQRCKEWDSFDNFKKWSLENGYDDTLSIDRRNYKGDYEPSNCRWVDRVVQNNNTARNVFIIVDGQRMTLMQAERKYGIRSLDIARRLKKGWSVEDAITLKPKLGRNQTWRTLT